MDLKHPQSWTLGFWTANFVNWACKPTFRFRLCVFSFGASSFAAHIRSCNRALQNAEAVHRSGGHALVVQYQIGLGIHTARGKSPRQARPTVRIQPRLPPDALHKHGRWSRTQPPSPAERFLHSLLMVTDFKLTSGTVVAAKTMDAR